MAKNLIERVIEMKAEREATRKKAQEDAIRQKEKEKADMIAKLGQALLNMRMSKESMNYKLQAELQMARKEIARRPNDAMLKKRHYQKIKMYYSFYKYTGMMLDQLELKNDEVMMGQGMAEFAETMKFAGVLVSQPLNDLPDIDKLTHDIEESLKDSGKEFEAIDKLLAGANEARDKSLAIANCSDELIDGLLNGSITPDDELFEAVPLAQEEDDMEAFIRMQMNDIKS